MNQEQILLNRIAELEEKLVLKDKALIQKDKKINYLLEQFRLAQQKQFAHQPKALMRKVICLMKLKKSCLMLKMNNRKSAILVKSQHVNRYLKIYRVSKLFMIFQNQKSGNDSNLLINDSILVQ